MKKYFGLIFFGVVSAAAFAGKPHYSYLRTIDLGTTASGSWRATAAAADSDGKIYITDNTVDEIGYLDPLTANVPADVTTVYDADIVGQPADPFGGSSFMGIAVDDNGTIFASGCNETNGPTTTHLLKSVKSGSSWTNTYVTGITGPNGGCDATGNGIIGLGNVTNGAVSAYAVSGSLALALGSPEPAGGVPDVIKVVADTTNLKGYQSIVTDNLAGRVDVYNSIAPYEPAANPLINPSVSSFLKNTANLHYQQISLNKTDRALCVSVNRGTSPGGNTFELYDLSESGKGLTAYQTINGTEFPDGVKGGLPFGSDIICYASAFFKVGSEKYLFLGVAQGGTVFEAYVFKQDNAGVEDWGIY
jgi:hypothetical protein